MSPFNKLLFASVASAAAVAPVRAADLEVEVRGYTGGQGQIMVAAFTAAESWLKKPAAVATAAADGKSMLLRLTGLPEGGIVALSLFQDLNGNGRLDANAMGMPQEPFGFSRDAVGNFGPPKFEQAAITLQGEVTRITVELH